MAFRGRHSFFHITIVLSSLLLFVIQPILTKAILPAFGGSAGVWVTAMMFFQTALLIGYLYAWLLSRFLSAGMQKAVHGVLFVLSLLLLPIKPHVVAGNEHPVLSILHVLTVSIGLPYLLLASTSPLLQTWFTGKFPYRLFALSNAGSVIALLSYPFLLEPYVSSHTLLTVWSIGYAIFVLCAGLVPASAAAAEPVQRRNPLLWIALATCASALWMAVANHLSQEVAPVPFLWVLPLSLYLLSFIFCFEGRRNWYHPTVFRWLLPAAWIVACYSIARPGSNSLMWEIAAFSAALFVWCMFCHGELASTKPEVRANLTFFYLMLALGGALGGIFVGVIAPNVFSTYLELPIGIVASVILALPLLYGIRSAARLLRIGILALAAFVIATRFQLGTGDVIHLRNFYGTLQVTDIGTDYRALYNGRTLHGVEFLASARQEQPTTYYGPDSGAGRILQAAGDNRRVGIVGLGAGTLAAYGRTGDSFCFYEINPTVIQIARNYFHFLDGSKAETSVVEGDGRLALATEQPGTFDVIVLDAFSDDSIPVHLMTKEAFALYFRLLKPNGVLAIHLTNRYLDLRPVVQALAVNFQKQTEAVHNGAEAEKQILASDWMLVYGQRSGQGQTSVRLWTDDYSNLFQLLR